jgi:hypothetical protein
VTLADVVGKAWEAAMKTTVLYMVGVPMLWLGVAAVTLQPAAGFRSTDSAGVDAEGKGDCENSWGLGGRSRG